MKPKKKKQKQGPLDPVKTFLNVMEALGITEVKVGPPPKPNIHRYVHRLQSGLEIQVFIVNNVVHSTYFNRTLQQLHEEHEADIPEVQQYDLWLRLLGNKSTEHTKLFYNGQPGHD